MAMSFPTKHSAGSSTGAGSARAPRRSLADGLLMKITIATVFLFVALITCGLL